jgi:hypothetical protein
MKKADALLMAIRNTDVGCDVILHNSDMSIWCILRIIVKEHKEDTDDLETYLGQGCKCCGDDKAETRIGWCFDCAIAQEIIGEVLGEEKPIVTNKILKTLAQKGYAIVEHKFIKDAYEKGLLAR